MVVCLLHDPKQASRGTCVAMCTTCHAMHTAQLAQEIMKHSNKHYTTSVLAGISKSCPPTASPSPHSWSTAHSRDPPPSLLAAYRPALTGTLTSLYTPLPPLSPCLPPHTTPSPPSTQGPTLSHCLPPHSNNMGVLIVRDVHLQSHPH